MLYHVVFFNYAQQFKLKEQNWKKGHIKKMRINAIFFHHHHHHVWCWHALMAMLCYRSWSLMFSSSSFLYDSHNSFFFLLFHIYFSSYTVFTFLLSHYMSNESWLSLKLLIEFLFFFSGFLLDIPCLSS